MGLAFWGGQVFQLNLGARQPLFVRMRCGQSGFNFVIADDAARFKVNQKHFAGLKTPFFNDFFFCHRQHAHFRSHHYAVIRGHIIARRAQAVPVERCPDLASIGKGDRRRPIPRLHQRGIIFIKCAAFIIHQRIAGPGFGNKHHHGVRQRISAHHQKFQRIVETGRVRLAVFDQRPEFFQIIPEQIAFERRVSCGHPVYIAAHRVDLTIVANHAERLRQ